MPDTRKRTRPPGSGRQPAGPDGEPRDQFIAFKVAPAERAVLLALLRRRGHQVNPAGMRDLLLELAEAEAA